MNINIDMNYEIYSDTIDKFIYDYEKMKNERFLIVSFKFLPHEFTRYDKYIQSIYNVTNDYKFDKYNFDSILDLDQCGIKIHRKKKMKFIENHIKKLYFKDSIKMFDYLKFNNKDEEIYMLNYKYLKYCC